MKRGVGVGWHGARFELTTLEMWNMVNVLLAGKNVYFQAGLKLDLDDESTPGEYDASSTDALAYVLRVCYWEEWSSSWVVLLRQRLEHQSLLSNTWGDEKAVSVPLRRFVGANAKMMPKVFRLDCERLGGEYAGSEKAVAAAWVRPRLAYYAGKSSYPKEGLVQQWWKMPKT